MKGCQRVIDAGVEWHAGALLGHGSDSVREGMCRLLSVVAGGTSDQISSLLSMTEEIGTVIRMAESETGGSGGWSVRKSAMSVLTDVTTWGDDPHVKSLVEMGGVSPLCLALTSSDDIGTISAALGAIRRILDVDFTSGEQELNFEERVYRAGGHYGVRRLTKHPDAEIRKAASYVANFRMTFRVDRSRADTGLSDSWEEQEQQDIASTTSSDPSLATTTKKSHFKFKWMKRGGRKTN